MKALHKLQQAFAADLWDDDLHNMQGLILDDQLSAAQRFNVYRNNFQTSLVDALAAIYPVVEQLVGREFFEFMADRYIRTYPSSSGNLHNLGHALPRFLGRFQAVSKLPYLAHVARLEWAYHTVFHAVAQSPFEPNALERIVAEDYPKLRFSFGTACRMVHSTFPIFRIWKLNQEGYGGDKKVNLDEGPEAVVIVRPEMGVELWRLEPAEKVFLQTLESGAILGDALEASLRIASDFDLQSALVRYLSSGVLAIAGTSATQLRAPGSPAQRNLSDSAIGRPIRG